MRKATTILVNRDIIIERIEILRIIQTLPKSFLWLLVYFNYAGWNIGCTTVTCGVKRNSEHKS